MLKHEEGEHLLLSFFASPSGINPCAEPTFIVHLQKRGVGATYSTLSTCFNQNHLFPGFTFCPQAFIPQNDHAVYS